MTLWLMMGFYEHFSFDNGEKLGCTLWSGTMGFFLIPFGAVDWFHDFDSRW